MDESSNLTKNLIEKADDDTEFRARLLANPKAVLEQEFDLTVADHHEIHVHEETATETHIVLPPKSKFSREERQEARTGASSLEFLKRTMYDPAPPLRSSNQQESSFSAQDLTRKELDAAVRESIRMGLAFLSSAVDENGAWHCIRFNLSDPNIPRHYERPAFISAFCALALESSEEPDARALCARTTNHLEDTIEYPGFWRYYRHLPQDLDSTTLSSLVLEPHPWIGLGRNIPRILANRDDEGRFMTWILEDDEPAVVALFRIEADPVVNANTIAYLGDRPETRAALRWLEELVVEDLVGDSSKWYPDKVAVYYAIARALVRVRPALDQISSPLADRIVSLRDESGDFHNVLQASQAVSALQKIGHLGRLDLGAEIERFLNTQRDDGSWPELLAFGDQSLKFGAVGQIGHGSESVTSAFCIEALECLSANLRV